MTDTNGQPLAETPLADLHRRLGARMVPFAGYAMPVQYEGILAEHRHCRTAAALFDVSHMGQGRIDGAQAAEALETLVPGDIAGLAPGRQRYTMFTNGRGGIRDDLMVANAGDHLVVVVNAANKLADFALLHGGLAGRATLTELPDRALLALQGPRAAAVMARLAPGTEAWGFMAAGAVAVAGIDCWVSRSGYTGEDGYEISVPSGNALDLAQRLLAEAEVKPAGLGARDSLRLEAGLCLHGSDIDESTTPIEAGLSWSIGKRRRAEGGFPGANVILEQLRHGTSRFRVGIAVLDRVPARAHAAITDAAGRAIGEMTSGTFSPTLDRPIGMGYVETAFATPGTRVKVVVRDVPRDAEVVPMPFVPHRYHKG